LAEPRLRDQSEQKSDDVSLEAKRITRDSIFSLVDTLQGIMIHDAPEQDPGCVQKTRPRTKMPGSGGCTGK
jgi:hypothetical protein